MVDHHITNQNYADINYINAVASSTCENLMVILASMGIAINKEIVETAINIVKRKIPIINEEVNVKENGVHYIYVKDVGGNVSVKQVNLTKIVVDAMKKVSDEMGDAKTFRGYPPEYGYEFLKDSVREYYKRKNISINNNDIFISDGAKSDLGNLVDIFSDNEYEESR